MPEFPPDLRCRHSATSSKLLSGFRVRVTPTGRPVQCTSPSFQLHVSALQLTFVKSCSPSALQPGPVPSRNAREASAGSSAVPSPATSTTPPATLRMILREIEIFIYATFRYYNRVEPLSSRQDIHVRPFSPVGSERNSRSHVIPPWTRLDE